MATQVDDLKRIKGTLLVNTIREYPAKDGKEAYVYVRLIDRVDSKTYTAKLHGSVAEKFMEEVDRAQNSEVTFDGKVKEVVKDGKIYYHLLVYRFDIYSNEKAKVSISQNGFAEATSEKNKEGLVKLNEVKLFRPDEDKDLASLAQGAKEYVKYEDFEEVFDYDVVSAEGDLVKEEVSKGFKPKKIPQYVFEDDLGRFGEALLLLAGTIIGSAGGLVGKWVNFNFSDEKSGEEKNIELQIDEITPDGVRGVNRKGEIVDVECEIVKPEGPEGSGGHGHGRKEILLIGKDSTPSNLTFRSAEILQPEIGQKFYSNELLYNKQNGFLGHSKEEVAKHLHRLLFGNKWYGDFKFIEKGQLKGFTGCVDLVRNEKGVVSSRLMVKNVDLKYSPSVFVRCEKGNFRLSISPVVWDELLHNKGKNIGVVLPLDNSKLIQVKGIKGNNLDLNGMCPVVFLKINEKLNCLEVKMPTIKECNLGIEQMARKAQQRKVQREGVKASTSEKLHVDDGKESSKKKEMEQKKEDQGEKTKQSMNGQSLRESNSNVQSRGKGLKIS